MPDDIDETWRGVVFGGEFELGDIFTTAESFKLAGDKLVEIAHKNYEERELFQPAPNDKLYADMRHIKTLMNWLSKSFKRIKAEQLKRGGTF